MAPVRQFDRSPGVAGRIDLAVFQVVACPYLFHRYGRKSEGRIGLFTVARQDTVRDKHRFWAVRRPFPTCQTDPSQSSVAIEPA